MWDRLPDREDEALEVRVYDEVPVLLGEVGDRIGPVDTGVGKDNVQPAETVHRELHRPLDICNSPHVAGNEEHPVGIQLPPPHLVDIEEADLNPLAHEPLDGRSPDSRGSTGDKRDFHWEFLSSPTVHRFFCQESVPPNTARHNSPARQNRKSHPLRAGGLFVASRSLSSYERRFAGT